MLIFFWYLLLQFYHFVKWAYLSNGQSGKSIIFPPVPSNCYFFLLFDIITGILHSFFYSLSSSDHIGCGGIIYTTETGKCSADPGLASPPLLP